MENTTEATTEEYKSNILSDEQVNNINNKTEGETVSDVINNENTETVLPSDESKNSLPEKYAGKSAEEVFRLMNIENEYKESKQENVTIEETTNVNETPERLDIIKDYTKQVQENGGQFSEDMYKELLEKGISKEEADLTKAGIESKQEENITNLFTSAETSREDFTEAGNWAKENWSEERVTEYNQAVDDAFKSGNEVIQKTLIRSLTEAYKNGKTAPAETYHTNSVPNAPKVEGYNNKSEFFRDQQNPSYRKDRSYREMVEAKFHKTDKSNW